MVCSWVAEFAEVDREHVAYFSSHSCEQAGGLGGGNACERVLEASSPVAKPEGWWRLIGSGLEPFMGEGLVRVRPVGGRCPEPVGSRRRARRRSVGSGGCLASVDLGRCPPAVATGDISGWATPSYAGVKRSRAIRRSRAAAPLSEEGEARVTAGLSRRSPWHESRLGSRQRRTNACRVDSRSLARGAGFLPAGAEGASWKLEAKRPADARDIQSAALADERCLLGGGARARTGDAIEQRLFEGVHVL